MTTRWSGSRSRLAGALALACALVAGPGLAQQHEPPGHEHGAQHDDAARAAYVTASERMHRDMMFELTGDPDVDFARGMIPHHQGAIDMARVVLEHGQDAEIRQLAEEVIRAQEEEIAFLRAWLERRGAGGD
jgi:uncharacterized protein (DUF305 family)